MTDITASLLADTSRFKQLFTEVMSEDGEISNQLCSEDEETIKAQAWLSHKPGPHYPRKSMAREVAYAAAWEKYMLSTEVPNLKLWWITKSFYFLPDQKVATLFATIFTWLGTNGGTGMVETAKKGGFHGMTKEWAKENIRVEFVNCGNGIIDAIVGWMDWKPEDLTTDLYRSTFQLMRFLDTDGRELIEYANELYNAIRNNPEFRWQL